MKKEYVITEISMSPDGSPRVLVSMLESKDLMNGQQPQPFRTGVTVLGPAPQTADSIAKELQKALSGALGGRLGSQATVMKLDIREYEESGLRVGDKVLVELTRMTKEEV